jgi:ATP-dependent exoDNAse (exonuclease V) beta subunit
MWITQAKADEILSLHLSQRTPIRSQSKHHLAHPRPPPYQQAHVNSVTLPLSTPVRINPGTIEHNNLDMHFAVEIPIWLAEDQVAEFETRYGIELAAGGAPRSITGHIDFLQVRNDAVHILDYKPDARTNKPIAQLAIYALALTVRVPGLKHFDIKCAWFNEEEYNEFFPAPLFAKR